MNNVCTQEKDPIQQCVASFFFSLGKLLSVTLFDGKLNTGF